MTSSVAPLPGVEGLDVSGHQADASGVTRVRWLDAYRAGRRWVVAKVTEGTWRDKSFRSHVDGARRAGLHVGGYHFARPKLDPIAQAKAYLDALGIVDLPPVLDLEVDLYHPKDCPDGLQPAQLGAWAESWVREVRALSGVDVVLYSYPDFLDRLGIPSGSLLAGLDLWVANYGARTPRIPRPWTSVVAWQYLADPVQGAPAGRCDGFDGPIDCNVFMGDEDDLLGWRDRLSLACGPSSLAVGPHTQPAEWGPVDASTVLAGLFAPAELAGNSEPGRPSS